MTTNGITSRKCEFVTATALIIEKYCLTEFRGNVHEDMAFG